MLKGDNFSNVIKTKNKHIMSNLDARIFYDTYLKIWFDLSLFQKRNLEEIWVLCDNAMHMYIDSIPVGRLASYSNISRHSVRGEGTSSGWVLSPRLALSIISMMFYLLFYPRTPNDWPVLWQCMQPSEAYHESPHQPS